MDYRRLRQYREDRNLPWFSAPWDLNLFVARSAQVGRWDDLVLVAFRDDGGAQVVERYVATSDASEMEWLQPQHPQGCVWILEQHVRGGYDRGDFKGRPALRQRRPFAYVRWAPSGVVPSVADLQAVAAGGGSFVGDRHTHLHNRVSSLAPDKPRTGDSRGCVVLKYWHQHAALIELVATQEAQLGTDVVSPTFMALADL